MTKLDISKNEIIAEGGKALAEGLKGNQVMTELNIAGNTLTLNASRTAYDDMSGVTAVAKAISGMGALTQFDISKNNIRAEGGKVLAEALKCNHVLTAINISSNNLAYMAEGTWVGDMSGIIAIADAIPDMRALTSLNISDNNLTDYRRNMSGKPKIV
jgi:Ran GTPase-activating protein (RanGAP) involved in mRNA processing and transport